MHRSLHNKPLSHTRLFQCPRGSREHFISVLYCIVICRSLIPLPTTHGKSVEFQLMQIYFTIYNQVICCHINKYITIYRCLLVLRCISFFPCLKRTVTRKTGIKLTVSSIDIQELRTYVWCLFKSRRQLSSDS